MPSFRTIIAFQQQQTFDPSALSGLSKKIANMIIETKTPSPIEGEEISLIPVTMYALPYSCLVSKGPRHISMSYTQEHTSYP